MVEKICFLDMDGVLCDFVTQACRVFGRPTLSHDWPAGEYSCEKVFGVTVAEFWKRIELWPNFWLTLDRYDWAFKLIEEVEDIGYRVVIASAPSRDPFCAAHKTKWLQNHFGIGRFEYFLGSEKHLLAKPGRVLIDDNDDNCRKFAAAGGTSILFPQRWNSAHAIEGCPADHVIRLLEAV